MRHEQHLACDLPVSMTTAALGGTVDVPTIDGGKTTIKIPAGTQTGYETKLKGKGMPVLRGASFGDLFVRVRVETPTNLSKNKRAADRVCQRRKRRAGRDRLYGRREKVF